MATGEKTMTRHAHVPRNKPHIHLRPVHPDAVPIIAETEAMQAPDQPFAGAAADALGADLRHRLVSEAAFHHLAERGYDESGELDDWRDARSDVEGTLLNPKPAPETEEG